MQFPPDAADLLAAVARLLDEQVLPAVPAHLQHPVRVAGHLARLVEREARLGPANVAQERAVLAALIGDQPESELDAATALAERIRTADDPELERSAWPVLVEITRRDLAVAKPGHDSWEGA